MKSLRSIIYLIFVYSESPSGLEEKSEEIQKRGIYLCAECPTSVYPSSDLLRLHLVVLDHDSVLVLTDAWLIDTRGQVWRLQ